MNDTQIEIEETLEPQAHGGALKREKKIDPVGVSYYGDHFVGYQTIDVIRDLIPDFKNFYYGKMEAEPKSRLTHIVQEFNDILNTEDGVKPGEPGYELRRKFHPNTTTLRRWAKKWNNDIMERKGMALEIAGEKKEIQQVLRTRGQEGYLVPEHGELEAGLQTLGGELMNDAMQILREDQDMEDMYESDELMKRKAYVVSVFGHVTKMVQGKANLLLKASQENRENASFLMELLNKSTAGKITVEEIQELKKQYQPKETIHVVSTQS